jgi:murein DD-endopeptidase MepM/ murein hydrolase activator NlpD
VRFFPCANGRRLSAALLSTTLAVGLAVPVAMADDGSSKLKDKQKTVKKQIRKADEDLHESSKRLNRALTRLDNARTQLVQARDDLVEARAELREARLEDLKMKRRLARAESRLQYAQLARIAGRAELDRKRDDVADMISSIYEHGDPELLAFASLMQAATPEDLIRQQGMQDVVVGEEANTYDALRVAEVDLARKARVEKRAKAEVAQQADQAAAHLIVMEELESDKEAAKNSVVTLVAERADASQQARKARAKDRRELAALEREDKQIQDELARLARIARIRALRAMRRNRAQMSTKTGGFLDLPTAGYITSPYGYRTHPIFGYYGLHDGVDLAADCGQPLLASADGEVVSKFWSTVYGNRLVIDNGFAAGVGLATIYAHATSYTVSPGDKVKRGQVIGYVGSTGWSTGCHLHFTVMANGKPVDPQKWF